MCSEITLDFDLRASVLPEPSLGSILSTAVQFCVEHPGGYLRFSIAAKAPILPMSERRTNLLERFKRAWW